MAHLFELDGLKMTLINKKNEIQNQNSIGIGTAEFSSKYLKSVNTSESIQQKSGKQFILF